MANNNHNNSNAENIANSAPCLFWFAYFLICIIPHGHSMQIMHISFVEIAYLLAYSSAWT